MSRRSEIDYLLDYLKEAFERFPEVRIRHIPVSSSPESDDGVTVRTEAR